jgi:hypothetical protein
MRLPLQPCFDSGVHKEWDRAQRKVNEQISAAPLYFTYEVVVFPNPGTAVVFRKRVGLNQV